MVLCVGNKLTLDTRPKEKGLSVRDELLKFHSSSYSTNIMALAVLGRGTVKYGLLDKNMK